MPRPRLDAAPWWPEFMELKDRYPLKDLADRFGVSVNGLSRALKRAGVERPIVRKARGPALGAQRKVDPRSAEAQVWWDEFLRLKDSQSLASLAEQFGVAEITLQRAMKRTGVSRRSQRGSSKPKKLSVAQKLAAYAGSVGVLSDAEVASLAGVSRASVANYRREHGIGASRGRLAADGAPEPSADAAAAAPAASKPAPKPASKPASRSAPKPGSKPASKSAPKPASKPASKSAPKPASKPAPRPASSPASPTPATAAPQPARSPRVDGRKGEAFLARLSKDDAEQRLIVVGRDLADAASQVQAYAQRQGGAWRVDGLEFVAPTL